MTYQQPPGDWNNPQGGQGQGFPPPPPGQQGPQGQQAPQGQSAHYGQPGQFGQPRQYGQPGQFGQQPAQGEYPASPAPAKPRPAILDRFLSGPSDASKFTIIGAVLAFLGLLLIVFSFLSWVSEDGDGGGSISGFGSVSLDAGGGIDKSQVDEIEKELEKETSAPGVWTLIFGVLLIGASIPLIVRKFVQWGVLASVLIGLAVLITASVFFASPVASVVDADGIDESESSAGYGLWIVFIAALLAFFVAVGALVLLSLPQKPAPAAGGWGQSGFGGQPGGQAQGGYTPPAQQSGWDTQQQPGGGYPNDATRQFNQPPQNSQGQQGWQNPGPPQQ